MPVEAVVAVVPVVLVVPVEAVVAVVPVEAVEPVDAVVPVVAVVAKEGQAIKLTNTRCCCRPSGSCRSC